MSNYTQQKFCFGTVWGADWGTTSGPPLEIPPGWGNCAYISRVIDAPAYISPN